MPPWRREFELDVGRQEVGRRNLFKEEGSVYGSPKQEAMGPSRNLKPSTVRRHREILCIMGPETSARAWSSKGLK